jgi:hypothetical protein
VSTARSRANHKLYLARLLLDGWREGLAREQVPAGVLDQAYSGAVREHLVQAYGWFLLELCRTADLPHHPPRNCAQLPPPPEGKAVPGEVREFEQLERDGWLGELLAERDEWAVGGGGDRRIGLNLASPAAEVQGVTELAHAAERLASLFDRMGDSLDEY